MIDGNRIDVELDNARARRWLLESIGRAQQRVHLQIYMVLDDDAGSAVEAALAEAGARGVTVRVLVDSLHGLHGSLGVRNPLLERLGNRPGVELRVIDPITSPPSLHDLKRRDHRKVAVIDGDVALLGGRNLSHEYYTGFDEVRLTMQDASPYCVVCISRIPCPHPASISGSIVEPSLYSRKKLLVSRIAPQALHRRSANLIPQSRLASFKRPIQPVECLIAVSDRRISKSYRQVQNLAAVGAV
ncbi:MAG TPA: phospholipase D-like domain-containing protein, partial [Thermoanaerobaculia bacterium]|nr:phospholipase D-like domain-containing protein [Thermoanaerobaculia bacterium]